MVIFQTPHDALMAIANFVKRTRLANNITMADLATRSGIGIATLARIEKNGICSTVNLVKVLAALGKLGTLITSLRPDEVISISELRAINKKNIKKRASRPV